VNQGSDCFLNASVQCLRQIAEVRDHIIAYDANPNSLNYQEMLADGDLQYAAVLNQLRSVLLRETNSVTALR
jgi:hypothetical protein